MEVKLLNCEKLTEIEIKLLEDGISNSPCMFYDINDYLQAAREHKTIIFGVYDTTETVGVFTVDLKVGKGLKVLILSLLAGKNIMSWRDDLSKFLFTLAEANKCTDFSVLGRKGFGKIFPELTLDGYIYSRKLI